MKDNIISVNLETSTAPIIQEVRGRDYIEYGTDDWRNLYPQFLIDLYYNSSTHAAIINGTAEMIAGENLIATDEDVNLEAYVKLKKFLRNANSKESLHQVIKKVAFDFKLQGAYALHLIWNRERTEIAEVYHVPVERVRAGRPTELGQVDTYYISADWSNTRTHKPYPIAAFNTNDRTAGSQLLYTGSYSPNMDIYHTPDYLAACNWALVDQRVAEFHLNNIENGFSGSYFISFANGVPTAEERRQIEQSLADKFTGAKNSGKFILTFSDDKTRTPEITPISVSDADKQYLALQELLVQNILTGRS
jgi:capsid portal protein